MLHVIKSNEIDTIIGKELGKSDWVLVDPVSYTHLTLPTILLV